MGLFLHTLIVTMVSKTVFLQRFNKKQFHGLAVALLLTLVTSCAGLLPGRQLQIISSAMEPTLTQDEVVRLKKVETIERGDIVAFNLSRVGDLDSGINDDAVIPFRVIGLPGEIVEVRDGQVFINQEPISEPYIKEPPAYTLDPVTVPTKAYFVLGDNRNNAFDSHQWGFLPESLILGKVQISN